MDGGRETAWVGYVLCPHNLLFIDLRKTIHIVVVAPDAEVLRQVDDLHVIGYRVFLEKLLALAVTETEEDDVYLVKGNLTGEREVGIADESFVDVADGVACVRLRIGKDNLCLRVVQQQADELTACIACRTQYSYLYHSFHA